MLHTVKIDRLFTLGDFKNVHVSVETTGITDEIFNDPVKMDQVRTNVSLEVLMNFTLLQSITADNAQLIQSGDWLAIYKELMSNRYSAPVEVLTEFDEL